MGTALTYARRYALFTLVGIAGEDDLDAPDFVAPTTPGSKEDRVASNKKGHFNGAPGQQFSAKRSVTIPRLLEPQASGALRDQLMTEVDSLSTADEATNWAHRALGKKNTLVENDATRVEQAFQSKLAVVSGNSLIGNQRPDEHEGPQQRRRKRRRLPIDKSMLAVSAPRRIRDREHVKSVAKLPCLVCGRIPSDAHHLKFAQSPALGRKVSDEFTVPLCRGHHREAHHCRDEAAWWNTAGIDPTVTARTLWLQTHPLPLTTGSSAALRMRKSKLRNEPNSGTSLHDHVPANRG
jgi:plasmid stabilization system protein ParE